MIYNLKKKKRKKFQSFYIFLKRKKVINSYYLFNQKNIYIIELEYNSLLLLLFVI